MKKLKDYIITLIIFGACFTHSICFSQEYATSSTNNNTIIIDHTCTDLSKIPTEWIERAKKLKVHFQHTSHGSQIVKGLERLGFKPYVMIYQEENLPNVPDALNIYDDSWPVQSKYWDRGSYDIPALDNNPSINVSLWSWCSELNHKQKPHMAHYFDGMEFLAQKYSGVTFIYITGHAQSWHGHHTYKSDEEGYNRYVRNEEIREYCKKNGKVLYDFADIDAWYNGEQAKSEWNGKIFPREHDHFNKNQFGHTSFENCDNKAAAFWWMLCLIAGWKGPS